MTGHRSRRRGPVIGLEIGSRHVRAAQLKLTGRAPVLQRYAQVDLPAGAVVDGEVVDHVAVGAALRQLWAAGRFSHHRVVVGVSSQRVIVREAELPAMSEMEVRSALSFEAEKLIPIPVDDAILDFSTVGPIVATSDHAAPLQTRILLAAAQRDMVNNHLAALAGGGLRPVAVYPVSLALLQGVPCRPPGRGEPEQAAGTWTEAVIGVGATVTTLAIREGEVPRFVRVLNFGSDSTPTAPSTASVNASAADRAPTQMAALLAATMRTSLPVLDGPTSTLIDDICGSIDFYLAKGDGDRLDRVVVTGGGALIDDFVVGLEHRLGQQVERADPLSTVTLGKPGLSAEQLTAAAPYLVTPIGLALWTAVGGRPLSLLPPEVLLARRERRQAVAAAAIVMSLGALLVLAWTGRAAKITTARHSTARAVAQVGVLQGRIKVLTKGTEVKGQVGARQGLYASALSGEVDWTKLLAQLSAVMPADIRLNTVALQIAAPAATPAGGAKPGTVASSGTITLTGVADHGPPSVAAFLRALQALAGLSSPWVQTIVSSTGTNNGASSASVTFNATASVTAAALSQRSTQAATKP